MDNVFKKFRLPLLALALSTTLTAADGALGDPTAGPPDKASPATAGWGFWPNYPKDWIRTFDGQLGRTKQGDVGVVFVGDSITQGWGGDGKALWAEHFAPLKAVNYGIGGDATRQVLWRIEHGLVDGLTPKLVVVAIGTNNLYQDYNGGTDAEIAAGVKAVVDAIHAKVTQAKILVLGMLPRQNSYFCDRIATINALSAKLDNGTTIRFLDPGANFLEAPGTVKAELYQKDQVHLTVAGYQTFAAAIQPLFDSLLK